MLKTDFFIYDNQARKILAEISEYKVEAVQDGVKRKLAISFDRWETHMQLFGSQSLKLSWGTAGYFRKLNSEKSAKNGGYVYDYIGDIKGRPGRTFANATIPDGFRAGQNLQINLVGKIGRKIHVSIAHNSSSSQNEYTVEYKGEKDEFVKSVKLGDVDLNVGGKSQFITVGGSSKNSFGIRAEGKSKHLDMTAIFSLTKGVSEVERRQGTTLPQITDIKDINYMRNRFFKVPDSGISQYKYYTWTTENPDLELLIGEGVTYNEPTGYITNYFYDLTTNFVVTNVDSNEIPWITNYDTNFTTNLIITNITNTYYTTVGTGQIWKFKEASGSIKILDNINGIIDTGSEHPGNNDYSILFYQYYKDGTNHAPSNNWQQTYFPNWKIVTSNVMVNTNDPLYSNFVIILPKNLTNMAHTYELRNYYKFPDNISWQSLRGELLFKSESSVPGERIWQGEDEFDWNLLGRMNIVKGDKYFYFSRDKPFASLPGYMNMYNDVNPYLEGHHAHFLRINYIEKTSGTEIRLKHWNVIPGSVVVKREEKVLPPGEYSMDYMAGVLNLRHELKDGEVLEISYEYQPFGTSLQRTLIAGRFDYTVRDNTYLGSTIAFSAGQKPTGAPAPNSAPNRQFVMNIDGNADLFTLINRRQLKDFSLTLGGEYAFSVHNKNSVGKALVNDIESDDFTWHLPDNHNSYFYSANRELENLGRILGKSYFIDFTKYKTLDAYPSPVPFTVQDEITMAKSTADIDGFRKQNVNFRPFETKPGPFRVRNEGHLSKEDYDTQAAMVFDYDFSDLDNRPGYVSYTILVDSKGRDFTRYNTLEIICKLVPSPGVAHNQAAAYSDPGIIGLSLDAGIINEDFDLDSFHDKELSREDINVMRFNYTGKNLAGNAQITRNTWHGIGVQGRDFPYEIAEGNGLLDDEDYNGNGILENWNYERRITYPSSNTTGIDFAFGSEYIPVTTAACSNIKFPESGATNYGGFALMQRLENPNARDDGDFIQNEKYLKIIIPLKQNYSDAARNILEYVTSIRLNLLQIDTNYQRGRLVIDSLSFKGTRWSKVKIDDIEVGKTVQFSAGTVDTVTDPFYKQNHLARSYRKTYEDLHGSLASDEFAQLREQAMLINYSLNGILLTNKDDYTNGRTGRVEKTIEEGENYDFSVYRRIKFFVFIKDKSLDGKEKVLVRFGENDKNYFELKMPVNSITGNDLAGTKWYQIGIKTMGMNDEEQVLVNQSANDPEHIFLLEKKAVPVSRDGKSETSKNYNTADVPGSMYTLRKIGKASLKKIRYFSIGVANEQNDNTLRRGEIWYNDIFLDSVKSLFGYAYRFNAAFDMRKDLKAGKFPIISGFNLGFDNNKKGYNFSSIGSSAEENQYEGSSMSTRFRMFNLFNNSYNRTGTYRISLLDQNLVPAEDQFLNTHNAGTYVIDLAIPGKYGKYFPSLSHSVTKSEDVQFYFTRTTEDINSPLYNHVNIFKREQFSKSYGAGENWNLPIYKDSIALNQSYSLSASIGKNITMKTNLRSTDINLVKDGYNRPYLFDVMSFTDKKDIFPIFNVFPETTAALDDKKDFLENAGYSYSINQALSGGLKFFMWALRGEYRWDDTHSFNYNTNIGHYKREYDIRRNYEPENYYNKWYEIYWPEIRSLFRKEMYIDGNSVRSSKGWSFNLSGDYNRKITFFTLFPILQNIRANISYSERESGFQYQVSKTFNVTSFSNYLNESRDFSNYIASNGYVYRKRFSDLIIAAEAAKKFFQDKHDYKDITSTMSVGATLPFDFGEFLIRNIPFTFSRSLSVTENQVLDRDEYNLWTNSAVWAVDENYYRRMYNQADKFIYLAELKDIWMRGPYINFGVFQYVFEGIKQIGYKIAGKKYNPPPMYNKMRNRAAEVIYNQNTYVSRRQRPLGSETITRLYAHDGYGESLSMRDNYSLSLSLKNNKYLDYIIPSSFSYSGDLTTSRQTWKITQNENQRFGVQKNFDKIFSAFNKAVFGNSKKPFKKSLSLDTAYNLSKQTDYNTKKIIKNHDINMNSRFNITQNFDIGIGYNFIVAQNRQYLQYYVQEYTGSGKTTLKNMPYLGIGEYSSNSFTNSYYIDKKGNNIPMHNYLNTGQFEDIFFYEKPADITSEELSYTKNSHILRLSFNWRKEKPFRLKLFQKAKKLKPIDIHMPANSRQTIYCNFDYHKYKLPFVNEDVIGKEYRFEPEAQPNYLGYRNMQLFNDSKLLENFNVWLLELGWQNSYSFSKAFTLGLEIKGAMMRRISAITYPAYLGIVPSSDNSLASGLWKISKQYQRSEDFIQAGIYFGIEGTIRF